MVSAPPLGSTASILVGLCAVGAIGTVDFMTGTDFGMSAFYAVPIFLAGRRIGLFGGVVVAIASLLAWVAAEWWAPAVRPRVSVAAWNAVVRVVFFGVVVALAFTKQRLAFEHRAALTDALTGIGNRRAFDDMFGREIARASRSGRPLTLAYIDCDNFKAINDTLGHPTGNDLLCRAAKVLASVIRPVDRAFRLGGDEFGVLLIEAEPGHVVEILRRLQGGLRSAMEAHGWPVTFSIGAATAIGSAALGSGMLREADRLMYAAKHQGKDTRGPRDHRNP